MKKLTLIVISFILLFAACKKDKEDPRDKYVGEYEGMGHYDYLNYSHSLPPSARAATLKLSKHPDIDNALIVDRATLKYFDNVGEFQFDAADGVCDNLIYVSNEGFLYLKGTMVHRLHKNCNYVEPDSLFTVVKFPHYQNGGYVFYDNFLHLKKK